MCTAAIASTMFVTAAATLAAQVPAGIVPGIDVLLSDSIHLIRGKRVGLLTNHTGVDRQGASTVDRLFKTPGVKLTALFGPEHGIRGEAKAGEKMYNSIDFATGLRVYSLYGDVQVPTAEMIDQFDVLVYDIQDVGARVYTYQWTLATAANAAHKPIIVLDRPNPIRADRFEGNILDPAFKSLAGKVKHYSVTARYGLTVGELMKYLVGMNFISANVTVVPMKNYARSMWYDETGLPRINPSPNLRSAEADLLYTGTVLFEGTNISEGRGTDDPFALIGAKWMTDNVAIANEMNAMRLPGVRFDTATRRIDGDYKFARQTIPMIRVRVTDRNAVKSVETGVRLMHTIYEHHPKDFEFINDKIDRLTGTDTFRGALTGNTIDALLKAWDVDAEKFRQQVQPYLIYK